MAYEVTATRRRPQKFDDLVGQEFVASTLKNAISNGQIAHAYLFSGPRGCGKTSTARILAKMLNCEAGIENAPCGECTPCREIAAGSSLDVIEIDGASNNSVENVRQIKDEVLFPPNSGKYKIYIIDEVHMLSNSAFNALLKTIEEPPPYVIFIFATTELHKVPATIKSRCQQFHFKLGSIDQIKNLLADTAREMEIAADDEALYWIARESTGSFRDAYTLFDQVAAFSGNHITYEGIRDKLGLVGIDRLNELCECCAAGNTQDALELVDALMQSGVSVDQCITNMADYLRSLLFIQSGVTKESLLGQSPERFSRTVLEAWDAIRLERALTLFLQLYRDVRYSLNPRAELEVAVTRLCWLSSYVSAFEVKQAIDGARSLLAGGAGTSMGGGSARQGFALGSGGQPPRPFDRSGRTTVVAAAPQAPNALAAPTVAQTIAGTPAVPPVPQAAPAVQAAPQAVVSVSAQAVPTASPAPAQPLTLAEAQEQIANELSATQYMLAGALRSGKPWTQDRNIVHIPVETEFLRKQLSLEMRNITVRLTTLLGAAVQVVIDLEKPELPVEKQQLPQAVQVVCGIFNGTVTLVQDSVPADGGSASAGSTAGGTHGTAADSAPGGEDVDDEDSDEEDLYGDSPDMLMDEGENDEL